MSASHKSGGTAAGQLDSFWAAYAKGVEELADLGRQTIDKAAEQNRELFAAWKKGVDQTVEGLQQAAQAQKALLAVAVERGRVVSKLATENAESVSKTAAGVAAVVDSLGASANSAQKQALEIAAAQSSSAYDAAKRHFETSGTAAVETFQRGVDTLLETQKTVLRARDAA